MYGSKKNSFAKYHDWDLMMATDEVMKVLEKMLKKNELKKRDNERDADREQSYEPTSQRQQVCRIRHIARCRPGSFLVPRA